MSNWSTLNKGITDSVKDALELQVERLLETYQNTLKLQQKGQTQLAKEKYKELVSKKLIKNEPKNRKLDQVDTSPLSTLRFLVFKNYASILKDEYLLTKEDSVANEAIKNYLLAVKIDPSDHSLWYYIGYLSQLLKKFRFARLAYETGFYALNNEYTLSLPSIQPDDAIAIIHNNKYTPLQWKCLEGLCQVLFHIGDDRLCEFYINIVLEKFPTWETGIELKSKLSTITNIKTDTQQATPLHIHIKKPDWLVLMRLLQQEYNRAISNNDTFIGNSIQIVVEQQEEEHVKEIIIEPPPVIPEPPLKDIENMDIDDNLSKRKREDEEPTKENASENENSENEEEAEEKRASLRASKRQRDKIANEESSRLKMLEEEKSFVDKIQTFYNMLQHIPSLSRGTLPWYQIPNMPMDRFWAWFDGKMSELESTYCWDIDVGKKINANASNAGGGGGQILTLFTPSQNELESIDNKTEFKKFIANVNNCNSGLTDILCKLIFAIIHQDENTTMNNDSLELMTDIISSLELNIIQHIRADNSLDSMDKIKIMLRISEYFVDRLIRSTIKSVEETNNTASTKRRASAAKPSKQKMLDNLIERTLFWISVVEQNLLSLSINKFQSYLDDSKPMTTHEELKIELRYCSIRGKVEQCRNNIVDAYAWFEKCKLLLSSQTQEQIHINLRSMYDSYIHLESIEKKLNLLQIGKLYVAAKEKMNKNDFEGVIKDLEDISKPKMLQNSDKSIDSDEDFQMINILASAYFKNKRYVDAWYCYKLLLSGYMKQLIHYGEQLDKRPSKNDDVEFSNIMINLNDIMNNLILLIQEKSFHDWFPGEIDTELKDSLVVLLRMSTFYIFRHPDFIPLVNNFTLPDVPPHTPSKVTKSNGFNDILIKSWVIQSFFTQYYLDNSNDPNYNKILLDWARLLQELHDELGEREICGASKSTFLQHLLSTLIKVDNVAFRREIYQCYHCLYGVHLAAESDMIEEHHCSHSELNQIAAEPLFALVVNQATEKLSGGMLLKNDLKDVIETVSELYEELPTKDAYVKNNQTVIENYLNSDIILHPSFNMMLRTAILPIREIDSKKSNISVVYYKMFWIRGKTLRLQIKNRSKLTNEKNMVDLEKAIEEYTSHIVLSPADADSWNELGACYQLLAEEELNWSASNIAAHKDLISEYQRKSFHAYLRGLYLRSSNVDQVFFNFGNLLFSMASSFMNMDAFKIQHSKRTMNSEGKIIKVQAKVPSNQIAYKFAMILYNHALQKNTDRSNWRCHYMIGKCISKINRPPTEILDWYLESIRKSKRSHDNTKPEIALEPIYIFCSTLIKFLHQGKIDANTVQEYLAKEKQLNKQPQETSNEEIIYLGMNNPQNLPTEVASAYHALLQRITEIKIADSRGWHHRPIYRIAWMQHYIYHNTEKAKTEIMKLFTLKPTIKNHINIWKPGFEFPGKHYEYIHKYTIFLIELLKDSKDTQTLKHLYRKLRRSSTLLIDDKTVFRSAYTSYLQIIDLDLNRLYQGDLILENIKKLLVQNIESASSNLITEASIADPNLNSILLDLAEIKRFAHGHVLPDDLEKDGLNNTIQKTFACILSKQCEIDPTISNLEDNDKKIADVLLLKANLLMQNISTK